MTAELNSGLFETGIIRPGTEPAVIVIQVKPVKSRLIKRTRSGKKLLRKSQALTFRSTGEESSSDTGQIRVKVK